MRLGYSKNDLIGEWNESVLDAGRTSHHLLANLRPPRKNVGVQVWGKNSQENVEGHAGIESTEGGGAEGAVI